MLEIKKFSAQWCSPCTQLDKVLKEIQGIHPNLNITKIDIEEEDDLCVEYNIRSIPVLVFEVDGIEQERLVGMQNRDKIVELINKYE